MYGKMSEQVPDARERYKQLLFYAKKLPPMPAEEHTDVNKVKGCVSQVGHWEGEPVNICRPSYSNGKIIPQCLIIHANVGAAVA